MMVGRCHPKPWYSGRSIRGADVETSVLSPIEATASEGVPLELLQQWYRGGGIGGGGGGGPGGRYVPIGVTPGIKTVNLIQKIS